MCSKGYQLLKRSQKEELIEGAFCFESITDVFTFTETMALGDLYQIVIFIFLFIACFPSFKLYNY